MHVYCKNGQKGLRKNLQKNYANTDKNVHSYVDIEYLTNKQKLLGTYFFLKGTAHWEPGPANWLIVSHPLVCRHRCMITQANLGVT